jgi:hypothetical protein
VAVHNSGGKSANKRVKERTPYEAEEMKGDFVIHSVHFRISYSYFVFSYVSYINQQMHSIK